MLQKKKEVNEIKKVLSLFVILCLLFSMTVVSADNNYSYSGARYDIDDFTDYLIKNSDGENTKVLVENYFEDQIQDNSSRKKSMEGFTETKIINGKEVKTSKAIKKVMLNDTQSITFYANGYFGIGEKIIKEPGVMEEQYAVSSFENEWAQYQYDGYNDMGIWIGSALVGQSFKYDGEYVAINSEPTGTYSYNQTLYTLVGHDIWSPNEVGELDNWVQSFSDVSVEPKVGNETFGVVATVEMFPDGDWYGDGGVVIIG